ncbi:MAG: PIG-L deacetylase family protein [Candidatus Rokuibacteriota bacterium]
MPRTPVRRTTKPRARRDRTPALPRYERALVVTAHPDDAEFGAGGTVARLAHQGTQVAYVVVTNGNKGSSDRAMTPERLARIRETEQRNAARALGVEEVTFLGYDDGEVEDTRALRLDVTRQIRRWRPELIITQNPHRTTNLYGSHRDHRITAGVVLDCVYPLARDHMSFPELLPDFEPHKVREVLVMQWEKPRLVVDITDTMDQKLKALACHVSQVGDFARVEARVRERSAELGKPRRYTYAETFDRIRLPR